MTVTVRLNESEKDAVLVALTEFLRNVAHSPATEETLRRVGRRLSRPEAEPPGVAALSASSASTADGTQTKVLFHLARIGDTPDDAEVISLELDAAETFAVDILKVAARARIAAEIFAARIQKEEEIDSRDPKSTPA